MWRTNRLKHRVMTVRGIVQQTLTNRWCTLRQFRFTTSHRSGRSYRKWGKIEVLIRIVWSNGYIINRGSKVFRIFKIIFKWSRGGVGSEDWGFLGIRRVRSNLFLGKEVKRGDLRKAKRVKLKLKKYLYILKRGNIFRILFRMSWGIIESSR